MDWHKETDTLWHDKVWCVHSEALYTLALAAVEANNAAFFKNFLDLHEWCQRHYHDPQYGEWYTSLHRDGSPKDKSKGNLWKAAYHLPRALMIIVKLFEAYGAEAASRKE